MNRRYGLRVADKNEHSGYCGGLAARRLPCMKYRTYCSNCKAGCRKVGEPSELLSLPNMAQIQCLIINVRVNNFAKLHTEDVGIILNYLYVQI